MSRLARRAAGRTAVILLALLLLPTLVFCPGKGGAQMLPGNAAPPVHPGTHLNFPPTLGGAQLQQSYTAPLGRQVQYVYIYMADKIQITVTLFDSGRRVPAGSENPMVQTEFTGELEAAEKTIKSAGYTDFERPAVPSSCAYGSIVFRCIIYSALSGRERLFTKLMMTGYNENFVKIRANWSQGAGQTSADADKALQAFIPALMH